MFLIVDLVREDFKKYGSNEEKALNIPICMLTSMFVFGRLQSRPEIIYSNETIFLPCSSHRLSQHMVAREGF